MDTILTKQTRRNFLSALFLSAVLFCSSGFADDYRDARAELVAAYQKADYPGMRLAADKALNARAEFPGGLFNLALAQTLAGDHQASLGTLRRLLEKDIDFGAGEMDEFAALRELDAWPDYTRDITALSKPVGDVEIHARYADPHFIPEGIAIDGAGSVFLGSIRHGELVTLGERSGVLSHRDSHWSVFGMRFHADGSLWFASAAVAQLTDVADDEGKTGLFRFDLETGSISQAAILPQYIPNQVLGDLIIADNNTIYATDSLSGAVYRYYVDSNEFEVLVERGRLGSPQGLVLDDSGRYLYVADYIGGLFRVSLLDGSLAKVAVPAHITDYGIDGMYRHGDELIVIQNGVRPHRVAAFMLSENGLAISAKRILASNLDVFDEPTLGVIRGDDFFFIANSHWNRFDRNNQLPTNLTGPRVLRLALR